MLENKDAGANPNWRSRTPPRQHGAFRGDSTANRPVPTKLLRRRPTLGRFGQAAAPRFRNGQSLQQSHLQEGDNLLQGSNLLFDVVFVLFRQGDQLRVIGYRFIPPEGKKRLHTVQGKACFLIASDHPHCLQILGTIQTMAVRLALRMRQQTDFLIVSKGIRGKSGLFGSLFDRIGLFFVHGPRFPPTFLLSPLYKLELAPSQLMQVGH